MELDIYLKPVDFSSFKPDPWGKRDFTLGALLEKNKEKLAIDKAKIVLLGVEEDRNAVVTGGAEAPGKIREYLYRLNRIAPRLKILDIGNLQRGNTPKDTYFALQDVCGELVEKGIAVVVLGGSQDLTFGITKAFEGTPFNLVNIDPGFDYRKGDKKINSENYLNFIFGKQSGIYSQVTLGYQNYFTDSIELAQASELGSETRRLGQLRYNMPEIEPYMRGADIVSFDLNVVRQMDAPGKYFTSPNGLYAEEACQIAHYAGIGDKVKVAGFFNLIPRLDQADLSASLMAQIVWHFIEGFYCRMVEVPPGNGTNFNEFFIEMSEFDVPLTFYQSHKTGRWWMKIYNEHNDCDEMIPCSQHDYDLAARCEIPDRWWRNIRKLTRKR